MEILLFVVLEAHGVDPRRVDRLTNVTAYHIDLLIDFVSLLVYVLTVSIGSRLQSLQKLDHKVAIFCIFPLVVLD